MPVASILSEITDLLTGVIGDYGLYAVFLLMLIDAVLPAASEPVMVYSGAVAAGAFAGQEVVLFGAEIPEGLWAYLAMASAGTIGYTLGAIGGWAIGYYGGRPYLERHGRWLHLSPEKLDRAERWFDRWDEWTAFLGRLTPVARSFVSIPGGVFHTPLPIYSVLTLLGSAIWCFGLAAVGWAMGANWERFHRAFHYVDYAVLAAIAAGVALLAWKLVRRRAEVREAARG